ncbi:MAG: hypothetical protein IPK19_05255 [Chloroflexi bacterium]|nr:hypothetical protein [Chloroflexota bacterium]
MDNPHWQHLGAWWVKRPMWDHTFGVLEEVEMLIRATQFMQAEGLRYALEADRRRKFRSSGTLPWQFNEPYPMAACTSAVDYFGQPKPSYYAVARTYAPLTVTAKVPTGAWLGQPAFHAEIWANHSGAEPIPDARLIARLVRLDGQVHAQWEVTISAAAPIPADGAIALMVVECPLDDLAAVYFLDLRLTDSSGRDLAANRYMFTHAANFAPLLDVPGTSLRVHAERSASDWRVTIQNAGANAAPGVWLEDARDVGSPGSAEFSDNDFCLLPGESRTVAVAWVDVPEAARTLMVGGWNTVRQSL